VKISCLEHKESNGNRSDAMQIIKTMHMNVKGLMSNLNITGNIIWSINAKQLSSIIMIRILLMCTGHGLADRQLLRGCLVSYSIGQAGDFLHGTPPRALDLKEKWRRSWRKQRHFSVRGDDKNRMRICRSATPWHRVVFASTRQTSNQARTDRAQIKIKQ
jgi:hypothetical protein